MRLSYIWQQFGIYTSSQYSALYTSYHFVLHSQDQYAPIESNFYCYQESKYMDN